MAPQARAEGQPEEEVEDDEVDHDALAALNALFASPEKAEEPKVEGNCQLY